jgi:hypothetical protein
MTVRLVFLRAVWLFQEINLLPIITYPFTYVSNTVSTMDSLEEALICTDIALPHSKTKNIQVRV